MRRVGSSGTFWAALIAVSLFGCARAGDIPDAGPPPVDSGPPPVDAGVDAGTPCANDNECGAQERCLLPAGRCEAVECRIDGHCGSRRCLVSQYRCVDCLSETDCSEPTPACMNNACAAECSAGSPCAGGQVCDATTGRCRDCAGDNECNPPNTVCETGKCIPGCDTTPCTGGETCDPVTGRCRACANDTECGFPGSGQICDSSTMRCAPSCLIPAGACPPETLCTPQDGRCRGCMADAECRPNMRVCDNMQCVPDCTSTGCTGGQVCGSSGRCRNCVTNGECGSGNVCSPATNRCVAGCTPGSCTGGQICDGTTMLCRDCSDDSECGPPAMICETGKCVMGCMAPPDGGVSDGGAVDGGAGSCGVGQECNTTTGRCQDTGGCLEDTGPRGCQPTEVCENGTCIDRCQMAGDGGSDTCAGDKKVCDANGHCRACGNDGECGAGKICESGLCEDDCNATGCTAPTPVCDQATRRCRSCQTDPECGAQMICESGACMAACTAGSCPGGQACVDGRCVTGCTGDAQCSAPTSVCVIPAQATVGSCQPGCGAGGTTIVCSDTEYCDFLVSGRCLAKAPLGASCDTYTDRQCLSGLCFNSGTGTACTRPCCASSSTGAMCVANDGCACPQDTQDPSKDFDCAFFTDDTGLCLPVTRYQELLSRTHDDNQRWSEACLDPIACRSGICINTGTEDICTERCCKDSDCGTLGAIGATTCRWVAFIQGDSSYSNAVFCDSDASATKLPGEACDRVSPTAGIITSTCASGLCVGPVGSSVCAPGCCKSSDCPDSSYFCYAAAMPRNTMPEAYDVAKACLKVATARGTGAIGDACSEDATRPGEQSTQCRGFCRSGKCTDTCCSNADCPSTHVCRAVSTNIVEPNTSRVTICVPKS